MMNVRLLALLVLVTASFPAGAEFRTVRLAYEVALNDFTPPVAANGLLTLRKCSSCEPVRIRVNAATRYEVNKQPVDLAEFRKQLLTVRDRDNEMVIVLHHLESDTVSAVTATI